MVCLEREPKFGLVITGFFILLKILKACLLFQATPPSATGNPSVLNFSFITPLLSIHFSAGDSLYPGRGRPSKVMTFFAPPWRGEYSAMKASLIGPKWNSFILMPLLSASSQNAFVRQESCSLGLSLKYPSRRAVISLKKGMEILRDIASAVLWKIISMKSKNGWSIQQSTTERYATKCISCAGSQSLQCLIFENYSTTGGLTSDKVGGEP